MKRVDLKVWFACNNHCEFCVQGDKRLQYKPRKIDEIYEILSKEYKNGATGVVFTGWEPTVYKHLLEAIRLPNELGTNPFKFNRMEGVFQIDPMSSHL